MSKYRTCFFTGHRIIAKKNIDKIKELIEDNIEEMIVKYDVRDFICGGAVGFDTIAAQTVIKMRESYPHIRLLLYLPCHGQSEKWTENNQRIYEEILKQANEYIYVTDSEYTKDCMNRRNMKMIEDSVFCIAYCIKTRSGTGFTVRNAEKVGIIIKNIADDIYEN